VVTGGTGFVGSNIVKVLVDLHGDEVVCPVNRVAPEGEVPYRWERVDMTDAGAVDRFVARVRPDAVVHAAILNDVDRIYADRRAGWVAYVDATRHYARAAARAGSAFVLVSTDWVFDGTQGPADEDTPPNPVNYYGVLKAVSEVVALEAGGAAAVARVSGVNGTHWARPATPRQQDPGFGYFVASLVDALEAGRPFTVWEADDINQVASPSLASMCGQVIRRIAAGGHRGVFHCCGRDAVSRRELAERTVEVFGLDPSLLRFGPPPAPPPFPVPRDTALSATSTASRLGTGLPSVRELLVAFREERRHGRIVPALEVA
jgi:dTDP-4-dehydrorhamnose reductase